MMNERIKLLVEQSLKDPDKDNDGLTVFDNDELTKFAELLVQECAEFVKPWLLDEYALVGLYEHFGVE